MRKPDDLSVLEDVLGLMTARTREEWIARMKAQPGFDPAWLASSPSTASSEVPVQIPSKRRVVLTREQPAHRREKVKTGSSR